MGLTFKLGTAPQVTTNYIPKANSNSFSNSLIFDNGTNIGIGTTSPDTLLHLSATQGTSKIASTSTSAANAPYLTFFHAGNDEFRISGGDGLRFLSSGTTERMRITGAGNVGIGTSSPTNVLHIQGTGTTYFHIGNSSTGSGSSDGADIGYFTGQTSLNIVQRENDAMIFSTNDTERMRITSGGNVLIGGTDVANLGTTNRIGAFRVDSSGEVYLQLATTGQSTVNHAFFYNSTGLGGSIRTSSGTISLVNGSDYRMKTNIQSLTEGLSIISKLKPCTFEYIATEGSKFEGFIAHELQEIIPNAVFGEKDAINEDGTPDYQGIDTVKIIPYLVKAIQEQNQLIQELSAKVSALENKS
jgi:hypothetical protein